MTKFISTLFILLLWGLSVSLSWATQDVSQSNNTHEKKKTVSEQQTNWGKWGKNYTDDNGEDNNNKNSPAKQDDDFLKELDDTFLLDYETHNIEELLDADEQELDQMEIELLDGL